MPSKRNATAKGKLNGAARKELNMAASNAVVERTVVGTNEDTVFGRVTKMWGNGHCQALVQSNGMRVELHKVRIPRNRLGKKGSTPINMSSVVAIFVGKEFEASKVRDTDQFDITAILDDKQVRSLVKQSLVPSWFLKNAEEIAAAGPTAVEDEGFEWDTSDAESSSAEEAALEAAVEAAAAVAISRAYKGKEKTNVGDALTKKQLREIKKAVGKVSVGKPTKSATSHVDVGDEDEDVAVPVEALDAEIKRKEDEEFHSTKKVAEKKATDDAAWCDFGAWRSTAATVNVAAPAAAPARKADAWIDNI